MGQALKTLALALGVVAATILFVFGFAIWVFIPLLPLVIVYLIAVYRVRRTRALPAGRAEHQHRKAA